MSNEMYNMVKEFHKAFNHQVSETPTAIPVDTALNRAVWTGEELIEFLYATVKGDINQFAVLYDLFKEGLDAAYNKMVEQKKPVDDIVVAQADALVDVEYFNQGSFNILGVEPFELFKIVQEANMSKLFDDGKPRYRESDGKIIKSPNFIAPEPRLEAEIERQRNKNKK